MNFWRQNYRGGSDFGVSFVDRDREGDEWILGRDFGDFG